MIEHITAPKFRVFGEASANIFKSHKLHSYTNALQLLLKFIKAINDINYFLKLER